MQVFFILLLPATRERERDRECLFVAAMLVKTILCSAVLAVLTVLSHSASNQQFKHLPRPAVRRDQKTFQQIQTILRKNYERTLRQKHEHFRRRNSRFLRADPLSSRYRRPGRTVVRRQRKIDARPTVLKVQLPVNIFFSLVRCHRLDSRWWVGGLLSVFCLKFA